MDNSLLLFSILGLTFVIALSQVLMLLFNSLNKHSSADTTSVDESYREKSYDIIHDAKSIKELEIKLLDQFKISLETADKSYNGFLSVLQENLRQQELKNQALLNEKTTKLIESSQNIMSAFIID